MSLNNKQIFDISSVKKQDKCNFNGFTSVPCNDKKINVDYDDKNLSINHPIKFINKYLNSDVINKSMKYSIEIKKLLNKYSLSENYDINNVSSIIMSHLIPTTKMAQKIYKKMGHNENEENYVYLTQAALLHDIGKIFIPSEILNKKGKLTVSEREIVELHNIFSYEILSVTKLNPKVARLTYEHHDYNQNFVKNEENQAITIADIYCALREVRAYKKSFNPLFAKAILYDMGAKGKLQSQYISLV